MIDPRKDLGTYTFLSKYAQYRKGDRRRETYPEAVRRMMDMHRVKFDSETDRWLDEIETALVGQRILGSQRALQFGGEPILDKNPRIFNCTSSFADRPRFFAEAFWLLLCGSGVGYSVQKHHVARLPALVWDLERNTETHTVADSIEGWADALDALIMAYLDPTRLLPVFDFSQVRPEGSPIRSAAGRAPGPGPLKKALSAVQGVLIEAARTQPHLRPIDVHDIMCHVSLAVRSGGVRRSAMIALFSPDDSDMANAKTGDWFSDNEQRRMANNSAVLVRATTKRHQFDALIQATEQFGEPGFYFTENTEHSTNPCAEIGLEPTWGGDDEVPAQTAWAFCNLTTINVGSITSTGDAAGWEFLSLCELASALGTFQAAYTEPGYLGPASKKVMERDALIGVSLTGMADRMDISFDADLLRAGASVVVMTNRQVAELIGIQPAARTTTVKPEGTGSLVLGVASGIHPHHAGRFLRYTEGGKRTDPLTAFIAEHIPEAVVQSAYNPDEVKIIFPIDLGPPPPDGFWLKKNESALDHLAKVRMVQECWVRPGTTRGDLHHNVSNTVQVRPGEWPAVGDYIWANRDSFAGVALLGASGDLDYPQCPFVEVLTEAERLEKYGSDPVRLQAATEVADLYARLRAAWVALDWSQIREYKDNTTAHTEVACAGGVCIF